MLSSVPVYDARNHNFDIGKHIEHLRDVLPIFEGEIPQGSFVTVGYTASIYKGRDGQINLSCNILWAVLVGTPEGY